MGTQLRVAKDSCAYNRSEFQTHYGWNWERMWEKVGRAHDVQYVEYSQRRGRAAARARETSPAVGNASATTAADFSSGATQPTVGAGARDADLRTASDDREYSRANQQLQLATRGDASGVGSTRVRNCTKGGKHHSFRAGYEVTSECQLQGATNGSTTGQATSEQYTRENAQGLSTSVES
jgi:hypothetical protein